MPQRWDRAFITDTNLTDEGYLAVTACPVSRPGVFPYLYSDGSQIMEAKLPNDLFSNETIQSVNNKPLTNDHPKEPVTVSNYKEYSVGHTDNDAGVTNNKLAVSLMITDAKTIQDIQNGKNELSIGFEADVQALPGDYDGMHYDAVQKNMRINHVAVVSAGRAGSSVSIKGDSAEMVEDAKNKPNIGGNNTMHNDDNDLIDALTGFLNKYKKNKGTGSGAGSSAASSNSSSASSASSSASSASSAASSAAKKSDAADDTHKAVNEHENDSADIATLKAENDRLKAELDAEKSKQLTNDDINSIVNGRLNLQNAVKPILGDSFDFTGQTDREIKVAAIKATDDSFDDTNKSDDYVGAYFDSVSRTIKDRGFTQDAAFNKAGSGTGDAEIDKLKAANLNRN